MPEIEPAYNVSDEADSVTQVGPILVAWRIVDSTRDEATHLLSPADRARLAGLTPARRAGFVAGRVLLRHLASELTGSPVIDITARCPLCDGPHGVPQIGGGKVIASISHSADLVSVAVAPTSEISALGLDLEHMSAQTHLRLADLGNLFPDGKVPSATRWTQIEAVLKADGRGLTVEPSAVLIKNGKGHVPSNPAIPGAPVVFDVVTVPGPPGAVISIATRPAASQVVQPRLATVQTTPPTAPRRPPHTKQ